jgi:hypothetical protein
VEGLYLPTALVLLVLISLFMGLFGAESRPGFDETRSNHKERWFFHSRND